MTDFQTDVDDLTQRFVAAFNDGRFLDAADCYTPDAHYVNPGPVVAIGRSAIAEAFRTEHAAGLRILSFRTIRTGGSSAGGSNGGWALQSFPTNQGDTIVLIGLAFHEAALLIAAETVVS